MRNLIIILLLPLCGIVYAQNITVEGIVKSTTETEGIIGVNVSIKGQSAGTITGLDGDYSLSVPTNATLVFSFIGYDTQEILVDGRTVINVNLKESSLVLDEVVAVGYRTERKADLTGAVSVVKIDDMMSAAENNPMKALQGRIAGMQVTSDGNPSGSATIRIRGIGTLNNNDPLYIVDGVPTTSGMHEMNSNDIESIQVLRDASAASIYGSRAANGVIVVTTKKGKKGDIRVNFDAYVTMSKYHNKIDVLSSKEYAEAMWKASVNSGINPNDNNLGIRYDYTTADGVNKLNAVYFPEYLDAAQTMKPANTDWFDQVTRTGVAQSYNLSVSNGTERGNYFFSLGYYDNEGLVKETDFSRISARMNSEYKLWGDILTIGENFSLNHTSEVTQPYQIVEAALIAVPFIPVRTENGKNWGGPINGLPDRQNPARLIEDNKDNRYRYWRMFGNAYLNIQPLKKLNIRSSFGLDYGNFYKRSLTYSYQTGFLESDRTKSVMEQAHWLKWTWSNVATYDFKIGYHRFETMAGMEMFRQEDINFAASREGFALETPNYMWPDLGTGTSEGTGISTAYSLLSFFGKINYSYADRYLLSATIRRDGSSRFGSNNRWGVFPAFNAGWKISQEPFMESSQSWMSDLKLRFGWGQTGNQEMANTAIYDIYVSDYGKGDPTWDAVWGTSYDFNGNGSGQLPSGFKRTQLKNSDLKWETTTQTNIGLDFGLFNQALYGSAEYYIKKTEDILFLPGYAAIKGEGANKYYNGASIENKGFEFSLGYRGKVGFGLEYDVTANISTNDNKVTYLPESVKNSYGGNQTFDNILGRPLGSFYGYVADGIFKSQEDLDQHCRQDGKGLGRIRYRDLNNDGVITSDDRTWIGDPFPDFAYGLNINLAYKNFDLTIYLQGIHNVDIINQLKYTSDFWSVSDTRSNKGRRLLNAWDPITNPNSNIPALSYADHADEKRFSSYFVENGSYLKLRNLQLGYNLPKAWLQKIKVGSFRTYVSAQNLFTIKSKSFTGVDPENPAWGYPIPLTVTFGINASF
ncbi:TonB-dependent receptor [Bacteroides sp. 214]|uniref:SusC/RagA family TonB-linked outer membrane protein n=1 Tax=Bacteroides sp. 214 TaxID=2302935 RepID=UPI0013D629CE|nr:TonB-dependent receptor [Bacteroides sp. 214]NDW12138.1 TonB-dependent receptor [Bacteroides sp. 214]